VGSAQAVGSTTKEGKAEGPADQGPMPSTGRRLKDRPNRGSGEGKRRRRRWRQRARDVVEQGRNPPSEEHDGRSPYPRTRLPGPVQLWDDKNLPAPNPQR
jgi:hypothetical protein